jgi:hypothetical protein
MSTTSKTPEEILKDFKQCNAAAKLQRAIKAGFKCIDDYKAHLEKQCTTLPRPRKSPSTTRETPNTGKRQSSTTSPKVSASSKTKASISGTSSTSSKSSTSSDSGKSSTSLPVIHVVDILDASGSMQGPKFTNAMLGINEGVLGLKQDKAQVRYTYSLTDFSSDVNHIYVGQNLSTIPRYVGKTRGSTALYDAICSTVLKVKPKVHKGDKVLVNIYTDGEENASRHYSRVNVNDFISQLSKEGWTFTFIGTKYDVDFVIQNLNIHTTNTMVYDGSAKGLAKSLTATRVARQSYSKAVEDGLDVSVGFYKDINDN